MYPPLYHLDKLHILEKTELVFQEIVRTCAGISEEDFFKPKDKFSAADHINHLEAAIAESWSKLFTPKLLLRWKYGKAKHDSFSYEQMEETCQHLLNEETQNRLQQLFLSKKKKNINLSKEVRIEVFNHHTERYLNEIRFYWEDDQLDYYQMPHEQLGLITAREWIYYTIILSWMQLNKMRKIKEETRNSGISISNS